MINANDFIPELFLSLTSKTYPHGYEKVIVDEMINKGIFPKDLQSDEHGNYFYVIGKSRTIFASHLDTVSKEHVDVTHVFDGDLIKTDGTTTLGADDKAGVAVMVWLMKNKVPGTYYFFIGEEVGCIGSGLASKNDPFEGIYDRIISFDRRGTNSIITHQSYSRCCSDEFADALCAGLNLSNLEYVKDDGGVYTDSAEFVDIIAECTNVSVGYYSEHTMNERQDIKHLVALCEASVLVKWEELPTMRVAGSYEPKSYGTYTKKYKTYDDYDYSKSNWSDDFKNKNPFDEPRKGKSWSRNGTTSRDRFEDEEYNYASHFPNKSELFGNKFADEYFEDEDGVFKPKDLAGRTIRRSKKSKTKVGKSYYDSNGELIEMLEEDVIDTKVNNKYKWVMEKLSMSPDQNLTPTELTTIKEQYLDIKNSDYDKFFYESLVEQVYGDKKHDEYV